MIYNFNKVLVRKGCSGSGIISLLFTSIPDPLHVIHLLPHSHPITRASYTFSCHIKKKDMLALLLVASVWKTMWITVGVDKEIKTVLDQRQRLSTKFVQSQLIHRWTTSYTTVSWSITVLISTTPTIISIPHSLSLTPLDLPINLYTT